MAGRPERVDVRLDRRVGCGQLLHVRVAVRVRGRRLPPEAEQVAGLRQQQGRRAASARGRQRRRPAAVRGGASLRELLREWLRPRRAAAVQLPHARVRGAVLPPGEPAAVGPSPRRVAPRRLREGRRRADAGALLHVHVSRRGGTDGIWWSWSWSWSWPWSWSWSWCVCLCVCVSVCLCVRSRSGSSRAVGEAAARAGTFLAHRRCCESHAHA
jgi:hypothetical protein